MKMNKKMLKGIDTVFIVWNYDDGILEVFYSKINAEEYIKYLHDNNFYHEEDMIITEKLVLKEGE